ncbi:Bgt-1000 [Blumeria graminis f. sp. tritici]|uniref:Bgt-1000 n=2 Tax=Blumeria graminis f. sp. tritici TaxID=62690 RepID=A0A061HD09_BLUGR|nr:hypothetical protein BGT96224_1000 [Blumeria graminis f. sp. tritici 96224]VDB89486.1 Bgt-1000 [Blumeria graminis f. sp. tritici]
MSSVHSLTNSPTSIRPPSSAQKTEVLINIYDLLPPGKLSSLLWACGSALLHSGVVINNREYAYGGHNSKGVTGIYYTSPKSVPPGGTFRCKILHGFTVRPMTEIDTIIKEASLVFQGTSYNILTKNCNHFTSYLLEKLTSRPGPSWLNRAANIGVALPCVVPKEWIAPPDFETADGELVEEDDDEPDRNLESRGMLETTDTKNRISVEETTHSNEEQKKIVESEESIIAVGSSTTSDVPVDGASLKTRGRPQSLK